MPAKLRGDPIEEVSDRLHSAAIHLLRAARRDDESFGLSAARLSALSVVVFAGPLSLGALAAAEQVRSTDETDQAIPAASTQAHGVSDDGPTATSDVHEAPDAPASDGEFGRVLRPSETAAPPRTVVEDAIQGWQDEETPPPASDVSTGWTRFLRRSKPR